uniref:hypothetical protein n=1 Tax=uncultured Rhizobium sp. TaxID=155567 RepID=UPI0026295C1A|nr:hypothetical protein [uncultured Rhizobium sp.]
MGKIGYVTWGNAAQVRSFQDFAYLLDDMLYLRELDRHDLGAYAAIIIPDVMDCVELRAHARQLNDYVRNGGFLIVFSIRDIENIIDVVDLKWQPVNARDWLWWTRPNPYLEVRQPEPRHPICDSISLADMSWHWMGALEKHPKAEQILTLDDDSLSLFMDFPNLQGGGRLMVTTLDPHGHNGERFMPATTRFLEAFYPWLNRELGIDREKKTFSLTYLRALDSTWDWEPPGLAETFEGTGITLRYHGLYDLDETVLRASDFIYIPNNTDEIFLRGRAADFLAFLERGGHLILSSQPAIPWLPFMSTFRTVAPRPFTNLKVRVRQDPLGFFSNVSDEFDGWQGIFGQYARGWTEMPEGAIRLTDIGPADDPKPADWLWKYPTSDDKGGYLFMHNGDSIVRYPDHGQHGPCLLRDICNGIIAARGKPPRPERQSYPNLSWVMCDCHRPQRFMTTTR